jgi:hypothetical protein
MGRLRRSRTTKGNRDVSRKARTRARTKDTPHASTHRGEIDMELCACVRVCVCACVRVFVCV